MNPALTELINHTLEAYVKGTGGICRIKGCDRPATKYSGRIDGPICDHDASAIHDMLEMAEHAYNAGDIEYNEYVRITSRKSLLTAAAEGGKVSSSANHKKEPTMARTSRTTSPKTARSTAVKATVKANTSTGALTAAQVAKDAGLSGPRFRAWLRANDMPRQFATKALATKAVAAFKKAKGK